LEAAHSFRISSAGRRQLNLFAHAFSLAPEPASSRTPLGALTMRQQLQRVLGVLHASQAHASLV
jgi:hypothetical protein